MALRLDTAVIRGEIDNTSRGNVRGKLWLVGHDDPIVIDLRGNGWRDVAGCKVTFTNPKPAAQAITAALQPKQTGYVGDITASRKVKVFTVPEEEWIAAYEERRIKDIPTEWRNALYVEWFSEANGRIVIESADFELGISEWIWEMDEADEEAQKMSNLHVMRGWLAGIIQRPEPKGDDEAGLDDEFDDSEESWEDSLKQSDRLNDAHMEALEKYGEDALDDDRVSFVMGWDHMLGESDDQTTEADDDGESWKDEAETVPEPDEDDDAAFDAWLERQKSEHHPLHQRARDLVLRLITEIKEERTENAETSDGTAPLDRFIRNTMNISGKLAGALGIGGFGGSKNKGYVLAILRRCLNWANEALAALNELMESSAWQNRLNLLTEFRAELFALRDGITDLRKELREK
jgi:hypothetical protein